jgi:hypothetical protein
MAGQPISFEWCNGVMRTELFDGRRVVIRRRLVDSSQAMIDGIEFYFRENNYLKWKFRQSILPVEIEPVWAMVQDWLFGERLKQKIKIYYPNPGECLHVFWCPACSETHTFDMNEWKVNSNPNAPSYFPSLKYPTCHLCIVEGKIHYCDDSQHCFAKQTIDMVEF